MEIGDLIAIAEKVLQRDADSLLREIKFGPTESALHAPFAGFGGVVLYPDPVVRAAILCSRLIRNHPFVDGNKRVAYATMRMYLAELGYEFTATNQDEVAEQIERLAAGSLSEEDFAGWLSLNVEGG